MTRVIVLERFLSLSIWYTDAKEDTASESKQRHRHLKVLINELLREHPRHFILPAG